MPDPRALATGALTPAARRELAVFGAAVELVLLPDRAARPGRPGRSREAFAATPVDRILRDEALWADDAVVVTPNRYPFADDQLILWSRRPERDHGEAFLRVLLEWTDATACTALLNTIGAAASIPRAHAHVTPEPGGFLAALPERPLAAPWLPAVPGAEFVCKDVPVCLVGVRGAPAARAAAVAALHLLRLTPACSTVAQGGAVWLCPRSPHEVPAPHFPHALGAAEVWGRWCYLDEAAFARARGEDLERALALAGCPPLDD